MHLCRELKTERKATKPERRIEMVEARGLHRSNNVDNPGTGKYQSEDNIPRHANTAPEVVHRLDNTRNRTFSVGLHSVRRPAYIVLGQPYFSWMHELIRDPPH